MTQSISEVLTLEAGRAAEGGSLPPIAEPQLITFSWEMLLTVALPSAALAWLLCSTPQQRRAVLTFPLRAARFLCSLMPNLPHSSPEPVPAGAPEPAPEPTPEPTSEPTPAPEPAPSPDPECKPTPVPQPVPVPLPPPAAESGLLPLRVLPPPAPGSPGKLLTADEIDARLPGLPPEILQAPARRREIAEAFRSYCREHKPADGLLPPEEEQDDYWFIGDVHGYLSALHKILAFIRLHTQPGRRQNIVFLGDLIDRGPRGWDVVATVQQLLMQQDATLRVLFIRGNHDTCFECYPDGTFGSRVQPCESVTELQHLAQAEPQEAQLLAEAFRDMVAAAPCMAELPIGGGDVLLMTHGGLPHVDLQEKLRLNTSGGDSFMSRVPEELAAAVSKDFTWVRLSPNLPRKHPNRGNSGCEMGYNDVNKYCALHKELTGRRITGIIRGHDHEPPGFRLYSYDPVLNPRGRQKDCLVVTINAMEPSQGSGGLYRECDIGLLHHSRQEGLTLYPLPTHHLC